MELNMRCDLLLRIAMVQMSLGDCPVSFRSGPSSRQKPIERRAGGKSLDARDLGKGGFLLEIR